MILEIMAWSNAGVSQRPSLSAEKKTCAIFLIVQGAQQLEG